MRTPIVSIPLSASAARAWGQSDEVRLSTNETVVTPAGTFKNCYRLNATLAGWGAGVSNWFAQCVGLVQFTEWKGNAGIKLYRLHHAKIRGSDWMTYTIGQ